MRFKLAKQNKRMRATSFIFFTFLLLVFNQLQAGEVQLSGVYKGKNLYVQNPFSGNMKDFCTQEVYVNGVKSLTNPQSSAYEIDLSHLKLNDPVNVKIVHKDDCKPKILNPVVIRSLGNFHFVSVISDEYSLSWSTRGEAEGGKHFIEHFVKGSWVTLKEIPGKASNSITNYKENIKHHSGNNKYRIKYLSMSGKVYYSKEIEFTSDVDPITFYPKRVSDKITLSRPAVYEIMDAYGNVIHQGKGKIIDASGLKTGFYYLNINNQTEKFLKK